MLKHMRGLAEIIDQMGYKKQLAVALVLGALSSFAHAPFSFTLSIMIGFSALYALIACTTSPLRAFFIGFFYMFGYFGLGLYWIGNALLVDDNPYWWAWPLAVSGMPLILSPFGALACYVAFKWLDLKKWHGYVGFIALITLSEWGRGNLFTGFPWNIPAYIWSSTPAMMQSVSLIDIYSLSGLTLFWCGLPAAIIVLQENRTASRVLIFVGLITFSSFYAFGYHRFSNSPIETVGDTQIVIVQPNIKQHEKWKPENLVANFRNLLDLSMNTPQTAEGATTPKETYIIWPETAFPLDMLNHEWLRNLVKITLSSYPENAYIIAGTLRYVKETDSYYNSIALIDKNAEILDIYDKNHLVPFGEYMPLEDYIDIAPIVGFKGFEKGDGYKIRKTPDGLNYFPLVCYEIIFPSLLGEENIDSLNLVINATNDGWYGVSPGPYQHLAQAQFRAIEYGVPVIRAANTGISAAIDPFGRIISQTQLFEREKLQIMTLKKSK